jgi:glycosyltransferase involved in cell wall biosynthesis
MSQPKVSVVLPTFNSRGHITRTLKSVAAQEFRDFELIVVDDGSTDGTPDVISADAIPALTLICHEENRGPAAARNSGLAVAKGEWIAFLDSDDTWHPDKLAHQVAYAQNAASQIWASCTGYRLHRGEQVSNICLDMGPGEFRNQILWGCSISPGSTLMVRREVFEKVGTFDESLRRLEDWDWLLRFSQHYDLSFLPNVLVDVFPGDGPAAAAESRQDPVLQALVRIQDKHLEAIRKRSVIAAAKFSSTLQVERASRYAKINKPGRAVLHVIAALLRYPARNRQFFQSLWRAYRQACTRSE